jgi:6-phosphofructokinase 1
MGEKIHRIGVLTSGGDAPGMNAVIRAVVRTCVANNVRAVGVKNGYSGLIHSDVVEMDARSVNGLSARGGTILYTARCHEFFQPEGVQRAAEACRYMGIDALVCIGGDGTFRGALELSRLGVPVIGVPATIDNDIGCSHYTIGFDTAANTAISAIDKLNDTMQSHQRTSVVEVMGRHAGHLAVYVGIAVGATAILIPEKEFDLDKDVIEKIRAGRYRNKTHHIVIVAEGVGHTQEIADQIEKETGIDTRVTIIGHIQRGGSPSGRDRVMATRMGHTAVESILAGGHDEVVVYRDSHICTIGIEEALTMKKSLDGYMYRVAQEISI